MMVSRPLSRSGLVQYEGELVAVVGRQCRNVSEQSALDYLLGVTLGNDFSKRSWQRSDRALWRARELRHIQTDGALDRHGP